MDLKPWFSNPFNRHRSISFKNIANELPSFQDPLDFLSTVRNIAAPRDARIRVHGAIHGALGEVDRAIISRFEELTPGGEIFGRSLVSVI